MEAERKFIVGRLGLVEGWGLVGNCLGKVGGKRGCFVGGSGMVGGGWLRWGGWLVGGWVGVGIGGEWLQR